MHYTSAPSFIQFSCFIHNFIQNGCVQIMSDCTVESKFSAVRLHLILNFSLSQRNLKFADLSIYSEPAFSGHCIQQLHRYGQNSGDTLCSTALNSHLSTTTTVLGPKGGLCTQFPQWLYFNYMLTFHKIFFIQTAAFHYSFSSLHKSYIYICIYVHAHLLFQLSLIFVMLPLYTGAGSGRIAIHYRVQRNTGEFLHLYLLACT